MEKIRKHAELNCMNTLQISAQLTQKTRIRARAARGDMVPRKLQVQFMTKIL